MEFAIGASFTLKSNKPISRYEIEIFSNASYDTALLLTSTGRGRFIVFRDVHFLTHQNELESTFANHAD